jgi:flagellar protein FlgJ
MTAPADISGKFALDVQAVHGLRVAARKSGQAGLEAAAQQFEALFLNMMLKSMREATPKDSLMDSEQSRLYISMLDQQLSQNMATHGVGLAEVMMRQLHSSVPLDTNESGDASVQDQLLAEAMRTSKARASAAPPPDASAPLASPVPPIPSAQQGTRALRGELQPSEQVQPAVPVFQTGQQSQMQHSPAVAFQERLMAHAYEASQATGIPAQFMLGHAALESGWGKRELRGTDGTPSHNLFGIKAGVSWKGPVVEAVTTEYVNGVARKSVEKFRAYPSYADAFRDYANLLRSNPRYAEVMAQAGQGGSGGTGQTGGTGRQGLTAETFAHGLQRAGYATDPNYADKLSRIIKNAQWS